MVSPATGSLGPLGIPAHHIHRIRGETPPGAAAAQAETELRDLAPPGQGGQPVLDLVFLGMGEEGHVASLFPGEPPEIVASPAVYRPVTASKPPPRRITLGYPAIAAARQVWVLAAGPGKDQAFAPVPRPRRGYPPGTGPQAARPYLHLHRFKDVAGRTQFRLTAGMSDPNVRRG